MRVRTLIAGVCCVTSRTADLDDGLAAVEAAGDARVPHAAALAILEGTHPVGALRDQAGLTLRDLAERSGISLSYLSAIEHGRKPGAVAVLTRVAEALGTGLDALVMD